MSMTENIKAFFEGMLISASAIVADINLQQGFIVTSMICAMLSLFLLCRNIVFPIVKNALKQ